MPAGLKVFFRYTIALLGAYFVAWTVAYIVVTQSLDFDEYFDWFVLAWTFRGFEMVGFTWLFSLVAFLPLAVVTIFLVKRLARRQGRVATIISK